MRIYFDNCCLQRPLDDSSLPRVSRETVAILSLLKRCEKGDVDFVASDAHRFEIERNTNAERRDHGLELLTLAKSWVKTDAEVEKRARDFREAGMSALDALHLGAAVCGKADYFCTCDDEIIRKTRRLEGLESKVVNPIELARELER